MLKKEISKIGVIVFTDMKDYTVKSSLMTNSQLSEILSIQENIFEKNVLKYDGKIIKSMGDGYMIFFNDSISALNSVLSIENDLEEYNKTKKIPLFKIETRIGIDYGSFIEKKTILGIDFFGTPINIASRIEQITSLNGIFVTNNIIKNIGVNKKNFNFIKLGTQSLKGIFDKVEIYELLNKNIKRKKVLKDSKKKDVSEQQKEIDELIFKVSAIGALISTQPIPFLDIYNLLALQIYLLKNISDVYGIKLTVKESKDILFKIIGIIGINYIIGQGVISLSKIGLSSLGGYLMIPITFSLTYAAGKVINAYMYYESKGIVLEDEYIKKLFIENIKKGRKIGKKNKNDIIETGKKNKDFFIERIKYIYKKYDLPSFYKILKNKLK